MASWASSYAISPGVGGLPGLGLLVEFGEQCDVGRIVAPAGFALHDEIALLVDADPVHGGDARVVSGEGARG